MLAKVPRLTDHHLVWVAVTLGVVVGMIILVGTWTALGSLKNCERIAHVDTVVQQLGRRGLATLGTPDGSAYAYYSVHPSELRQALAQLHTEITDFNPPSCSLPF